MARSAMNDIFVPLFEFGFSNHVYPTFRTIEFPLQPFFLSYYRYDDKTNPTLCRSKLVDENFALKLSSISFFLQVFIAGGLRPSETFHDM